MCELLTNIRSKRRRGSLGRISRLAVERGAARPKEGRFSKRPPCCGARRRLEITPEADKPPIRRNAASPPIGRCAQATVPWVIVLFSIAFFGQQSWSTLVMILPTDLFPKHAVGTVAGFVGLGGALGGVVLGQLAGWLLDHGFSYTPVLVIAGSLHVAAFFLIMATVRSLAPLPLAPPYLAG